MPTALNTLSSKLHTQVWLPLLLILGLALAASRVNFLFFHTVAEMLSIVIAFTAMIVASQSKAFIQNTFVVYLATVIGWCAVIDFLHTLAYDGMNLLPTDGPNPATQLWIAARMLQAIALVISPLLLVYQVRLTSVHLALALICTVLVALIATGNFPDMFISGEGLTPLKIYSEYVIIAFLVITLIAYWKYRARIAEKLFVYLSLAIVTAILSEFAFTKYVSVYSTANMVGHLLKICTYWFIYLALVDTTLSQPFSLLSRSSTSFDSIPDPTIVVASDGKILQANHAAAKLARQTALSLVDQTPHQLFHDPDRSEAECPVCVKMTLTQQPFTELLSIQKSDKVFEYSIAPFLSDINSGTRVQVIRDVTSRERSDKTIRDLTYLYRMLSATNRAIVHCDNEEELLASLFKIMVKGGAFPFLFFAVSDQGRLPLKMIHAHGLSAERLTHLSDAFANPDSPTSQLIHSLHAGEIQNLPLSLIKEHDPWIEYLRGQGITNRVAMPLMTGSVLHGVIILYTSDPSILDEGQLELLRQLSADISFALNGLYTRRLIIAAEKTAEISEKRFSEIFENTPLPLQIIDINTNQILKINEIMKSWLGDELAGATNQIDWLSQAFATDEEAERARQAWDTSRAAIIVDGKPQYSPEFRLKAQDGSFRIARAAMTVVDDEAIIAWSDLTDIRQKEQALIESERHFRLMIEQSVAGIFVRREGKFIYVNSRYAEMLGRSREELIGRSIFEFTSDDSENLETIKRAWEALEHGQPTVTYNVQMKHQDGQLREFELHSKIIDWDGMRAHIVLADDITVRQRQQDQIADYIRQLEASMKGTLSAVANMVEMRDPYTAGHERRVGLIARDIALEMGWDEKRANSLELIGLVHDIGKIAIPAEILTKPSRLSPIEMELVRGHVDAGYEILKDVPFPIPVADIIRQHHERIDGSGYPLGLKGDEILPEAKILAVADVIESMATHRPYRAAVGMQAALQEVTMGAGTKFDPEVVKSVERLITLKNYQLPT
ncbi:MASE3 domain-containing protein [Zwartia sp.]|uniref:MASE3 domain-containing protein n=1 Tax=Zwartia sp. TaxID=2978004 RepID=UPI00271A07A3|nr:MASE3 domain-containing protein [Zwartia sp.]MDO9025541.1 MASE3 domain-containing protein [Zwartia sp.]